MASLKLHSTCDLATRFVPIIIGGLSYYGHIHHILSKFTKDSDCQIKEDLGITANELDNCS